ncbi:MAG: energy-coupling factor ABC transporter permease [Candidatus Dadabacteria bacterium]|nr:energy-coupling factor ABC transporter permease [Candidatus Dadabacteria bacterium]
MSHIHIPDGVLPLWIVAAGWVVTALLLALCIRRVDSGDVKRKLPLIGIVSALMIAGMTLEIVPIAYHINLSIIAGILLGPALAFVSVFIVDLIISMFGHGGITVVGLNTMVIGAEAVLGYYLFQAFRTVMAGRRAGWASALAAVMSLFLSTSIMLGVVYVSHINPAAALHTEEAAHDTHGGPAGDVETEGGLDFGRFVKTIFLLAPLGWALEAAVTGLVVSYLYRVRPDLVASEKT